MIVCRKVVSSSCGGMCVIVTLTRLSGCMRIGFGDALRSHLPAIRFSLTGLCPQALGMLDWSGCLSLQACRCAGRQWSFRVHSTPRPGARAVLVSEVRSGRFFPASFEPILLLIQSLVGLVS
jgi:hypothetical protein